MILTLGNLQFLDHDMHPNRGLRYVDAMAELRNPANLAMQGSRWRLPTVSEMWELGSLRELEVANFSNQWYWTSDPFETFRLAPKDSSKPRTEFITVVNLHLRETARGVAGPPLGNPSYHDYASIRPILIP